MSFDTYDVYFAGGIMKGHDAAEVKKKLGALFKFEGARLDRLFSGEPVAIKKGINMDQAVNYRVVFRQAGALVDIRPVASAQQPPAVAAAPGGVLSVSAPNNFDLSDCAPAVPPQPIPDISALELDKPGAILDESVPVPPLEIDIAELELDEPGVTLDETGPTAAPSDIDIQELTLQPANQGSLEDCQKTLPPSPIPNIDHLELEDKEAKITARARIELSED